MAYKLIKTDSFHRDLDAVIAYIALSLENRIAAASLLDAVEKSYDGIERMPLMYEGQGRVSGAQAPLTHGCL